MGKLRSLCCPPLVEVQPNGSIAGRGNLYFYGYIVLTGKDNVQIRNLKVCMLEFKFLVLGTLLR